MRKRYFFITLVLIVSLALSVCDQKQNTSADTILINGKIYTVNPEDPWAQAIAIIDGKIIAAGSDKLIAPYQGPSTKVIDARGHMVLPGFVDAHLHILAGASVLEQVSLNDAKNITEFQKLIQDYAADNPDREWIQGMGWYYNIFGKDGIPDKKYIDEVVPDRPVYLAAYDGHSSLANSKALELAGITRDTPDPPAGIIMRDPETGEPTGVLKEAAGQLMSGFIPQPSKDEELTRLTKAIHYASSLGFTRLISAGADAERVELFDELRKRGDLTLRLYMARFVNAPVSDDEIRMLEENRKKYNDDWIDLNTAKFLLDGVIEAHTAAMLEPYDGDPDNMGILYFEPDAYKESVLKLDKLGFTISTHAIGDRAIRLALDAYEAANKANNHMDARDRIEHIECPDEKDIPRFGKLGVIASMQPLHTTPNENIMNVWVKSVGPERDSHAWPWHDILAGGATVCFGSDWPVVTVNPWPAVEMLLTRETPEGIPEGGWLPEQRLTLDQAIKGYTMGGAIASKRENREGSIEAGKLADVIIISQNLFEIAPDKIGDTKVLITIVGGNVVYKDPLWSEK